MDCSASGFLVMYVFRSFDKDASYSGSGPTVWTPFHLNNLFMIPSPWAVTSEVLGVRLPRMTLGKGHSWQPQLCSLSSSLTLLGLQVNGVTVFAHHSAQCLPGLPMSQQMSRCLPFSGCPYESRGSFLFLPFSGSQPPAFIGAQEAGGYKPQACTTPQVTL